MGDKINIDVILLCFAKHKLFATFSLSYNMLCYKICTDSSSFVLLNRHHHASVFVMCQERVLSTDRLRILQISPPSHKVSMRHGPCQLSGNGSVHGFGNTEICREEDIKVALVYLWTWLDCISQQPRGRNAECKHTRGVVTGTIFL